MTLLFFSRGLRRVWNAMRYAKWRRVASTEYEVIEGEGSGWTVVLCALPGGRDCTATAAQPSYGVVLGIPETLARELYQEALRHLPPQGETK